MVSSFQFSRILGITIFLFLGGCINKNRDTLLQKDIQLETSVSEPQDIPVIKNSQEQKAFLEKIYTQAISDYIIQVSKEYKIKFDTLYIGKRVFGEADDFPDIDLPASIENTYIKLMSPEEGKELQKERKSSFYINLIGNTNSENAEFIFVTFSNGFGHQFDFYVDYAFEGNTKSFVKNKSRFER